jgi:hypothetical protein
MRRPIPAAVLETEHRWAAETVHLVEPVSAYEVALKADSNGRTFGYSWNANLVGYYQDKLVDGHVLVDAWQEVSFGTLAGLLDTIRTRILNLALDIKSEIGESDIELKKVVPNSTEAEKVNRIVINNIFGGTVYQGDQQSINIQQIEVGNWEDLKKALLSFGIEHRGQRAVDRNAGRRANVRHPCEGLDNSERTKSLGSRPSSRCVGPNNNTDGTDKTALRDQIDRQKSKSPGDHPGLHKPVSMPSFKHQSF